MWGVDVVRYEGFSLGIYGNAFTGVWLIILDLGAVMFRNFGFVNHVLI